jgi:nitrous oxide reductase accessory protein NosL
MKKRLGFWVAFTCVVYLFTTTAYAEALVSDAAKKAHEHVEAKEHGSKAAKKPTPEDKCPVCGMAAGTDEKWVAQIAFKDDLYVFFDGAKDMFKYLLDMKKYNPAKTKEDIAEVYVTDYYSVEAIDAHHAYFVIGSDVKGPMGAELVPFKKEDEAKKFLTDHKGQKIVQIKDVTLELVQGL